MAASLGSAYTGSIDLWAPNFAPRGWAFCHGQLLSINDNQVLFSLIGTIYGGDGRVSFALPNLQGRVPLGAGHGPGLKTYPLGEMGGSETVTLTKDQMPAHTHTATFSPSGPAVGSVEVQVFDGGGLVSSGNQPAGKYLGPSGSSLNLYYDSPDTGKLLGNAELALNSAPGTVDILNAGASQQFHVVQPVTVMHYIICLSDIYPPRN